MFSLISKCTIPLAGLALQAGDLCVKPSKLFINGADLQNAS